MNKKIMRVRDNQFDQNTLEIVIRLSERCNYSCTYCNSHNNTEQFHDYTYIIDYLDRILSECSDRKIVLYFHGGEPTIVPKFKEILFFIYEKYKNVHMDIQTNTSQSLNWFKQLIPIKDNIQFLASYQHHQNKDHEKYIEKLEFLLDNGMLGESSFMLEQTNTSEIIEVIKKLQNNDKLCDFIDYNYVNHEYNPAYKEVEDYMLDMSRRSVQIVDVEYNDGSEELLPINEITNQQNNFNLYKCTAGHNRIIVDINGDVFYCVSHKAKGSKPVCNIYKENKIKEIISKKYIYCTYGVCSCELWLEKVHRDYGKHK